VKELYEFFIYFRLKRISLGLKLLGSAKELLKLKV